MVPCAMCYGHAADCECPVAISGPGARSNSYLSTEYEFTEINEPQDRLEHEDVAPNYYLQLYLEIQRSLPEGALRVVPKRFSRVFKRKQENSVHYFAGMAKPLSTNKIYDLSKEKKIVDSREWGRDNSYQIAYEYEQFSAREGSNPNGRRWDDDQVDSLR
jgi:hypothetical protein